MNALAKFAALLLAVVSSIVGPVAAGAAATEPLPGPGLVVEAAGQCPEREAVMAALRPVLGDEAMRSTSGLSRVSDLGDRFEVVALGQTRQYADPARDCAERARVAAVFITLAVNPPMFAMPPPPPPATRIVGPPPPPISTARPSGPTVWTSLAAAGRVDGGSGGASTDVAAGAELRAAIGHGALGAVATAGLLAPIESQLSSVVVHQQRFPCSVSLIGRRALSRMEGSASAGVALVPFTLSADGLATPKSGVRMDVGGRLAFELRFPVLDRRLAPFVDVHAEYFPRPYMIDVDPLGTIGSTGRLWLGATAGLSLDAGR